MTLSELREHGLNDQLPKLIEGDYQILWVSDFWDGPRSGLLSRGGEEAWFEVFAEDTDDPSSGWYRRFAVVVLTPEQLAKEHEIHGDFQQYVGTHWDGPKNDLSKVAPKEQWHLFYDKHLDFCRTRDFGANLVVAWFET